MAGGVQENQIPDKIYFKIGEVSKIVGVKPYVLRYWETEFKEIGPSKSRSNQRLYRRKDVDTLLAIKNLLYNEGFTITGARKKIRDHLKNSATDGKSSSNPKKSKKSALSQHLEQMPIAFEGVGGKKVFLKLKQELQELRKIIQARN